MTKPMARYGRYDLRYLLMLRTLMMRDLTRRELWDLRQLDDDGGNNEEEEAPRWALRAPPAAKTL